DSSPVRRRRRAAHARSASARPRVRPSSRPPKRAPPPRRRAAPATPTASSDVPPPWFLLTDTAADYDLVSHGCVTRVNGRSVRSVPGRRRSLVRAIQVRLPLTYGARSGQEEGLRRRAAGRAAPFDRFRLGPVSVQ